MVKHGHFIDGWLGVSRPKYFILINNSFLNNIRNGIILQSCAQLLEEVTFLHSQFNPGSNTSFIPGSNSGCNLNLEIFIYWDFQVENENIVLTCQTSGLQWTSWLNVTGPFLTFINVVFSFGISPSRLICAILHYKVGLIVHERIAYLMGVVVFLRQKSGATPGFTTTKDGWQLLDISGDGDFGASTGWFYIGSWDIL